MSETYGQYSDSLFILHHSVSYRTQLSTATAHSSLQQPTTAYSITTMSLPTGFPEQLKGPMAWDASDFVQNPEAYTLTLTESDLLGIRTAVNHFKGKDPTIRSFIRY